MKKILLFLIVVALLISGVNAANITNEGKEETFSVKDEFYFSTPQIIETGEYLTLEVQETDLTLNDIGKPQLPMVSYTIDLPFGSKNVKINYETLDQYEMDISNKIKPTPQPVTLDNKEDKIPILIEDEITYSSTDLYPSDCYDSRVTCGILTGKERSIHISLYLYPVQYSPAKNKLYYTTKARLEVTYEPPEQEITFNEEYDMVIIAPEKFEDLLNDLVDHKNSKNVKTFLKTTESIFNEYEGYDKPEKIKYFIKDAMDTYNIENVLLVGGLKTYIYTVDRDDSSQGSEGWHVPVRYSNIEKSGLGDPGTCSDLYYADIYDGEMNFSSWDTNNDHIYGKWSFLSGKDELDLNPDVRVGRLACRNKWEVKTVIKKIKDYENSLPTSAAWYKTMIGATGLNHDHYLGQPDGEYLTDLAFSYMEDDIDSEIKVYASNEDSGGLIPVKDDIIDAFKQSAHYAYFSGHGHPLRWDTHPVDDLGVWIGGIRCQDLWGMFNNIKPLTVIGGCHSGQYNITLWTTFQSPNFGNDEWYWTHGMIGFHCFCWRMVAVPWGGAVATVGGAGLTTSLSGDPNTGNAQLCTNIFYEIGQDGATTFGEAFTGSMQKYVDENEIKNWDAHVLGIWHLFGDPSLKL